MDWLEDLLRCYIAAKGRFVLTREVARRLGREPTPAEMAAATRAVNELIWVADPDVSFVDQPRQVEPTCGGGSRWR